MGSSCEDSFVATIFLFTTYQNNMKAITCLMKETEVPYFHNFSLFFLFIKNFSLRLLLLFICIIAISGFASAQNDAYTYYFDGDGDGYGKTNSPITSSSPTPAAGYAKLDGDCNDGNASINPGATEICGDGIDNNCDGQIDEGCTVSYTYYFDGDGDGYGKTNSPITSSSPTPPAGYAKLDGDCNDGNASVNPGATEICGDGIDNNCDGQIDEGCTVSYTYYFDGDGDGYGKTNSPITSSSPTPPSGYAKLDGDCNDGNASVNPGATEICDGIDNNCDGKSGTITFTAGSTKQNISISIIGDKTVEPDEMFKVNLSNAVNASIVKGIGTGTILNDDGVTAISSASLQINNNTSERSVKISPNPVSSILRVDLSGYTGNVTMQLVSLQGKTLKQEKMQAGVLKYMQQQMNVTGIASGTYFLTVIDEKGSRQTEKVIIAR